MEPYTALFILQVTRGQATDRLNSKVARHSSFISKRNGRKLYSELTSKPSLFIKLYRVLFLYLVLRICIHCRPYTALSPHSPACSGRGTISSYLLQLSLLNS